MGHIPSFGRLILSIIIAVLACISAPGAGQTHRHDHKTTQAATACPERIAHWPYGPSQAVAAQGDTAYFGVGTVLRVADVSSLGSPVVLSEIPLGDVILDIEVSGDLLIAAISESGIAAVDISDPINPELLDTLNLGGSIQAVAIVDDTAYVGGDELWVIDSSDPCNLGIPGTLSSGIGFIRDLAVSGSVVVLAENSAFLVVDVSDPSSPSLLATHHDDLDRPVSVDISGDYAFLLESHDDIVVFDISNPVNPSIVQRVDPDRHGFTELDIDADRLYVGSSGALMIYDIINPITPVELWNDSASYSFPIDLAAVESTLYLAQGPSGLGTLDVSVPSAPLYIGESPAESSTTDVDLWDTYAVTILGAAGLAIFDLSQPSHPVEISRYHEANPNELVVRDDYAYGLGISSLQIIDLSDPWSPLTVGSWPLGGHVIALSGNLALIGGSSDGIRIVDIGDPSAPVELALINVDFTVTGIAGTGPAVYVPEINVGLHIFDVSTLSNPVEMGVIELPDIDNDNLATGSGLLAVGDRMNGIRIYDVSNPLQPVETAFYTGLTRWGTFTISDDLLIVTAPSDGLHILDISDPSNPVPLGDAPLIKEYSFCLATSNGLAVAAEEYAGFEIFDLEACALGPVLANFSWSPVHPWVGTTVEFTDGSTGGVTAWSWTFGDGETSTGSDPSHVYHSAGTYSVQLSVTGPTGTDAVTKTVTVTQDPPETPPIEEAGARQWVIPAAAHSPGAQGTNWVSDIVIHNPGGQAATANVYFMKKGKDNSGATGRLIQIPAGASTTLNDIVFSLFDEDNTSGAVLIGSEHMLLITSRTYNDASSGTFGQYIPGIPIGHGAGMGEPVRLMQLTRNDTFRTNIGWANPTASSLNISVDLQDSQGNSLKLYTTTIPPYGYKQATDVFGTDINEAKAVISTDTGQAKYFTYASVVDNRTGDPILILESDEAEKLFIPAAAHVQGLTGTDWKTDLELSNRQNTTVECTIDLLKTGYDNTSPESALVSVLALSNVRVRDVLGKLFHHSGSAALGLSCNQADITATSWTYNLTDAGTYGQFIPGTANDAAISQKSPGLIVQLSQSGGNNTGYRTNLGLLNVTAQQLDVVIDLYDSEGAVVGTDSTVLEPFEHRQINRIFREVTSTAITNGFALVSTTSPKGAFLAYASVVDNRSGDPVYIPAWVTQ